MSNDRIQALLPPWLRKEFSIEQARLGHQQLKRLKEAQQRARIHPHKRGWKPFGIWSEQTAAFV